MPGIVIEDDEYQYLEWSGTITVNNFAYWVPDGNDYVLNYLVQRCNVIPSSGPYNIYADPDMDIVEYIPEENRAFVRVYVDVYINGYPPHDPDQRVFILERWVTIPGWYYPIVPGDFEYTISFEVKIKYKRVLEFQYGAANAFEKIEAAYGRNHNPHGVARSSAREYMNIYQVITRYNVSGYSGEITENYNPPIDVYSDFANGPEISLYIDRSLGYENFVPYYRGGGLVDAAYGYIIRQYDGPAQPFSSSPGQNKTRKSWYTSWDGIRNFRVYYDMTPPRFEPEYFWNLTYHIAPHTLKAAGYFRHSDGSNVDQRASTVVRFGGDDIGTVQHAETIIRQFTGCWSIIDGVGANHHDVGGFVTGSILHDNLFGWRWFNVDGYVTQSNLDAIGEPRFGIEHSPDTWFHDGAILWDTGWKWEEALVIEPPPASKILHDFSTAEGWTVTPQNGATLSVVDGTLVVNVTANDVSIARDISNESANGYRTLELQYTSNDDNNIYLHVAGRQWSINQNNNRVDVLGPLEFQQDTDQTCLPDDSPTVGQGIWSCGELKISGLRSGKTYTFDTLYAKRLDVSTMHVHVCDDMGAFVGSRLEDSLETDPYSLYEYPNEWDREVRNRFIIVYVDGVIAWEAYNAVHIQHMSGEWSHGFYNLTEMLENSYPLPNADDINLNIHLGIPTQAWHNGENPAFLLEGGMYQSAGSDPIKIPLHYRSYVYWVGFGVYPTKWEPRFVKTYRGRMMIVAALPNRLPRPVSLSITKMVNGSPAETFTVGGSTAGVALTPALQQPLEDTNIEYVIEVSCNLGGGSGSSEIGPLRYANAGENVGALVYRAGTGELLCQCCAGGGPVYVGNVQIDTRNRALSRAAVKLSLRS